MARARPVLRCIPAALGAIACATAVGAVACGSAKPPSRPALAAPPAPSVAAPAPSPTATADEPRSYQVQAGDTLAGIATRFGTSVEALKRANRLTNDAILVGETLALPATETPEAAIATPTPPLDPRPAVAVYRGRTDSNAVALTFDAGADVGFTRLILDTLRRNDIRATFGMTGQWAQDNPDLVKEMAAGGHQLMNHTWDHRSFTGASTKTRPMTQAERWAELDRCEAAIKRLTGQTTYPYFRAPFGDDDASVEADAGLRGYRYDVLWTVDTGGWEHASVGQIVAAVQKGATPGAIIVMHVGADSQDGPALQSVIDAVREKGLGFATVAQLVGPN